MKPRLFAFCAATVLASGCTSITGLTGAKSGFACKAPDGITCTSVSGVYANVEQDNVPGMRKRPGAAEAMPAAAGTPMAMAAPGMPIRSQARMLRIWMAPWRDEDDALHDQSYVYIMLDAGKWMVEHSRDATVRKSLASLQPSPATSAARSTKDSAPQGSDQSASTVPGDASGATR